MSQTIEPALADVPRPLEANLEQIESQPQVFSSSDLVRVAFEARTATVPPRASVRTLLSWFGAQRRGSFIVWLIRGKLEDLGIQTEPDFDSVWIDSEVSFVPIPVVEEGVKAPTSRTAVHNETSGMLDATQEPEAALQAPSFVGGAIEDPTYRIGKLDAANKPVVYVAPNHSIRQAITLMLMHGFSQLPVMQGDRDVKGILTWENIGARLSLGNSCSEARECMTRRR